MLHSLNDRPDAIPLFIAAQAALAQYDQPRMGSNIEQFNEISRICGNNRKIVIECVLSYGMICSTSQANMRYGLSVYAGFGQSTD